MGELGIEPASKEERKAIDMAVRTAVGKGFADPCPEVWKEVKTWLQDEKKKQQLVEALRINKL
jgi:hypothetical protein